MRARIHGARASSLFVLLPLLVIAIVWPERAGAQPEAVISGTIVARATGQPIVGATVAVEGSTAVSTNGIGRFELRQPGPVTVVVSAPGYLAVHVPNLASGTPITIELVVTPNFMDRVQVTATKSPESVGDIPAAPTTLIDRETMDRRGDQRLTEAIEHVPGALVTTELGIFESVLFRGMPRVGNEFTNTLLLIDGVPQTNAGNDARVVALPIYDTGSIEVLRGPNSALYGRTAIGGTINILTADPTTAPELKVDLTGGQFGTAKGVVTASGPLQRWGGYHVSVGRIRSGGYYRNLLDTDFSMGNTSFFGKLRFVPDPSSIGSVTVNRVTSANSTPTNEPIIGGRLLHDLDPAYQRFTSFNLPGPNYRQNETRFTANYTRRLASWARLVETFGYRDVQRDFIEDGDFIGEPYSLEHQTVTMYPFNQQTEDHNLYQEARLELAGRTTRSKPSLVLGGSYERNKGNSVYDGLLTDEETFGFPDFSYVNPIIPDRSLWLHDPSSVAFKVGIAGLFGQFIVEPVQRVVVTLAGRYDRLALDARQGTSLRVEQTYEAFSPKAGVTVRLLESNGQTTGTSLNAFGAYSQAFLPPRRPSALQAADTELNLKPEDIENYEAGLKGGVFGGRLAFEASYFHMTEDGVVINRFVNNRFIPSNAGQLRYKGFETGATWTLKQNVTGYANGAFYRNRYGDFVIQSSGGSRTLSGNRLVLSPDYIVNWGFNVLPVPSVNLTVDVKHVSSTFGNDSNTARIDGYTLFDAGATWQRGPLRITLSGRNLLSQEYYFDVGSESADPGPPRQILLSTTVRLGK